MSGESYKYGASTPGDDFAGTGGIRPPTDHIVVMYAASTPFDVFPKPWVPATPQAPHPPILPLDTDKLTREFQKLAEEVRLLREKVFTEQGMRDRVAQKNYVMTISYPKDLLTFPMEEILIKGVFEVIPNRGHTATTVNGRREIAFVIAPRDLDQVVLIIARVRAAKIDEAEVKIA